MAMTPEGKVKKRVKEILDALGAYHVMYVPVGYGANKGTPDFLVCHKGRFIGIETKAGKGKTTALQDLNLQKIRDAGGVAWVITERDFEWLEHSLKLITENEDD